MIGAPAIIVIKPPKRFTLPDLAEFWAHREILFFFLWRDLLVRYKQTFLGVTWVVLQPVMMTIIFTAFFGHLAKLPSAGTPYQVFSFAALLPWQYFAASTTNSSTSLLANRGLITKIYFPRLIIPISSMTPLLVDFSISFMVFLPVLLFFNLLTAKLFLIFLLVPFMVITALGPALWLSALVAYFRDFRIMVPFLVQFLMFLSPVAYSSSMIPAEWRIVYSLNPLAGLIDSFRWTVLINEPFPWLSMSTSLVSALVIFISGLLYFKQVESGFSDVV